MSDSSEFLRHLNRVLRTQLTSINQHFLHARILKHKGCLSLADSEYKQSLDNMKQSDMLVEHILRNGGSPNLQELGTLLIGDTVEGILQNDLHLLQESSSSTSQAIECATANEKEESLALLKRVERNQAIQREYLEAQLKPYLKELLKTGD